MTVKEIQDLLNEQIVDHDENILLLQPLEELPCIYDLLEAYIPDQSMGLEILQAQVETSGSDVIVTGYAAFFGLPPVKMEALFSVNNSLEESSPAFDVSGGGLSDGSILEVDSLDADPDMDFATNEFSDVTLTIIVMPEMGVTPAGLFPELTGSGLWVPLMDLKLELKSFSENPDETPGSIKITAGLNPGLDDLLGPLGHLLGKFAAEVAPVTGTGEVGEAGTLVRLRIDSPPVPTVDFGMVKLSDIKIALVAEENETGLLQAALLLEGLLLLELKENKTISVDFSLMPAPPDRPFHMLSAHLSDEDGETADVDGLAIPLPKGIPNTLQLQSIRVLLGAVSGVPEEIAIAASLGSEWPIFPGLTVKELGGNFTVWPTADPISGRAEIYGSVILGGETLHFTIDIPEMDFSIELDPNSKPNIKTAIAELTQSTMPEYFPDMVIDGLSIKGDADKKLYNFYFGLSGDWNIGDLLGLNVKIKSVSISGNVDNSQNNMRYWGTLRSLIQLGEEPSPGEKQVQGESLVQDEKPDQGETLVEDEKPVQVEKLLPGEESLQSEGNNGLIELSVELTSGGNWIFSGGLAPGTILTLPQLASVVKIPESSIPGDLQSLCITELNASFNTGTGEASFHAASGFSLDLPFGGGGLDLKGSISLARKDKEANWVGEAAGEVKWKTLRLKVSFPIKDPNATPTALPQNTQTSGAESTSSSTTQGTTQNQTEPPRDIDLTLGLWLPQGGDPENGMWLKCEIDQGSSGTIDFIRIILPDDLKIFKAIEGFINLMIPGFVLKFPSPWDGLLDVTLPPSKIEIDTVKDIVKLAINGGFGSLNEIPGIDIKSVSLEYKTKKSKIEFQLEGKLFGETYTKEAPLTFDPVNEDPPTPKVPDIAFELRYLGLGRHVAIRDVAQYQKVGQAIDALRSAFDEKPQKGGAALGPMTYSDQSQWLIGFDFTAAGFLSIGAIFNDPLLYGLVIRMDGPAAKAFSGFEFEILYKRIAPGLGVYSMELELPSFLRKLDFGAISLTLPVIGVDIYTNGNFKLDLGFPYGGNFDRSFGISVIPFTGAGGFYYASLNGATSTTVPRIINGQFNPVIEFGIGLRVGVGKSFGSGCFQAHLFVGLFAILEGCFATFLPYDKNASEALFYRISGSFGIRAVLRGRIDFKIICISFCVELYIVASIVVESYMPIYINARAGVRVSARVKIGWFKITFRFSTSVSISYTLGSRKPTPWVIGSGSPAGMGPGNRRANAFKRPLQNREIPMTMANDGAYAVSPSIEQADFDWTLMPGQAEKTTLTWYSWFGVSADLDSQNSPPEGLSHIHVATPLAGFAEMIDTPESAETPPADFNLWVKKVFDWLLSAGGVDPSGMISFSAAYHMDYSLQENKSADRIDWNAIETFIANHFNITLKTQPENPDENRQYKLALVPLPPVLHIDFNVAGNTRQVDLSQEPLVEEEALEDIQNRSNRYSEVDGKTQTNSDAHQAAPDSIEEKTSTPLAEHLWKDVIALQIKELASRLLALMESCPITMSGNYEFNSIGEIYENLVFDPDPSDADREPYFEEFIEANMDDPNLRDKIVIIIPQDEGEKEYEVENGDTLAGIAEEHGITAIELAAANLYAPLVKPGSVWNVVFIKEISAAEAWEKLIIQNALSDISAMTSRFLLHGVRMQVKDNWQNLYEAGALQFDLPVNLKKPSSEETSPDSTTDNIEKGGTPPDNAAPQVHLYEDFYREHIELVITSTSTAASQTTQLPAWLNLQTGKVNLQFTPNEDAALIKLMRDSEFNPEAQVMAMDMTREEEVDFTLARSIPLRTLHPQTGAPQTPGRLRVLPPSFFSFLEKSLAKSENGNPGGVDWFAAPLRSKKKQGSRVSTSTSGLEPKYDFQWVTRIDLEVLALEKEMQVEGRPIYRAQPLSGEAQLKLERILSDLENGLINISLTAAIGVAGALSSSGGLLAGDVNQKEIVLFRNDADERPDTPAAADNRSPLDFLRLLAESIEQEPGTFFFSDVLPGVDDSEERIFAGAKKGIITLVLFPKSASDSGVNSFTNTNKEINPIRHADSIYLTSSVDKGGEALRLCAEGLTQKKARFEPNMLHFRLERQEPDELTGADALESLYSLFSFYFSDEDGSKATPPSLPVGPREESEEKAGTWLYEQIIPVETAFENPGSLAPYATIGQSRWLNISWRDLFGNEAASADYTFSGFENPVATQQDNLKRIKLTSTYYDEIIGVNRWPGVQAAHVFQKSGSGAPEVSIQVKFDPSILGEREPDNSQVSGREMTAAPQEEISKIIAQLGDTRLKIYLETTLEENNSAISKPNWKPDLEKFLRHLQALLTEAQKLEPLEITPGRSMSLEKFVKENRIGFEELAISIRTMPLADFFETGAEMAVLKIPIKWQCANDSINSIANALHKVIPSSDLLIETLLLSYVDEPGLLTEGILTNAAGKSVKIDAASTIATTAAALDSTPENFLLEFADREGLLAEKKVLLLADLTQAPHPDETLGQFSRQMLYYIETEIIGGVVTAGFTLAPDAAQILVANKNLLIQPGAFILLDGRVKVPEELMSDISSVESVASESVATESGANQNLWRITNASNMGDVTNTTNGLISLKALAQSMGISVSDFAVLHANRADIIEKNIAITISIPEKTNPQQSKIIKLKTAKNETLSTLKKEISTKAAQTITTEQLASALGDLGIIKPDCAFLIPPAKVVLSRKVTARKTPAAYELKAHLVLQRFGKEPTGQEKEWIHPQMHDEISVWHMPCDIPPGVSSMVAEAAEQSSQNDQQNESNQKNEKTANLRPYALLFENAFQKEKLYLGMGAKRKSGAGDKPSLWAVRLGAGGFAYQINGKKPGYLSLRPLSTTPKNRKDVPVFTFEEDRVNFTHVAEDQKFEKRNYSDIDFDEWARHTLEKLDRMFDPAAALALSEAGETAAQNSYDKLLVARAKLAAALTTGLTEVIDYTPLPGKTDPAQSEVTRRIMKERIGNRLACAYDIDTAAFFPLSFTGAGAETFEARGSFIEDRSVARDTGYTLQATTFQRSEDYLAMAVDVIKPEEHRSIDTKLAFCLDTIEFETNFSGAQISGSSSQGNSFTNEKIILSFVIAPTPDELGELSVPVALRDLPEAPQLSRQQGVADFEMNEKGYPDINSFDELLAWRYEVDFLAEFAEQDTHTMEIFFNVKQLEGLPLMLGGNDGLLFQDLFHALAQCDATLQNYADVLKSRVEAKFKNGELNRSDLHWILDDLTLLIDELAVHWDREYNGTGSPEPVTSGETLQTTKHRYVFTEERYTRTDTEGNITTDDLRYTFTCAPGDPPPMVWVDGIEGKTAKPKIKTLADGSQSATYVVTLKEWFAKTNKTSDDLEEMPRRFGFTDLHILEKQNVRVRIKTVRNAELVKGQQTAEAFIYRTPIVTLPDRFFPSVEMEKRVRVENLLNGGIVSGTTVRKTYHHPTELLADILHGMLGLGYGPQNAGIKRRLALSVRYGFSVINNEETDWSDPSAFISETPLFFEPRFILDHVPDTTNGVSESADDAVSRLGREMQQWLDTAGARRENAGFVIGVDVYTDETLNPALVERNPGDRAARDDARLMRVMRLEAEFPGGD